MYLLAATVAVDAGKERRGQSSSSAPIASVAEMLPLIPGEEVKRNLPKVTQRAKENPPIPSLSETKALDTL